MSNWTEDTDKLESHLEELIRKHRELDTELEVKYNNMTVTDEVRRLRQHKYVLFFLHNTIVNRNRR